MHTMCQPILFLVLLSLLLTCTPTTTTTSSSPLSTIAIAKASSATIICALLPTPTSSHLDLNCTAAATNTTTHIHRQRNYPSASPFSAIAGGDNFLCALGPILTSPASTTATTMRWWVLSSTNRTGKDSKRVYKGAPITGLSSSGYKVCGILHGGTLHCWRWPGLIIPGDVKFSFVAVGADFVCALVVGSGNVCCFGNDTHVVGNEPAGNYAVLAAEARHACVVSTTGDLSCWGAGAPTIGRKSSTGITSLALGKDGFCGLRGNGSVVCFGDMNSKPPGGLGDEQFVAIQAQGDAFCGVLMANFSLVCWGSDLFVHNNLMFGRVLPGPCVPMTSCACGVLPGSGNLCGGEDGCICQVCLFGQVDSTQMSSKVSIVWIVIGVVAIAMFLVALVFLAFRCRRMLAQPDRNVEDSSHVESQMQSMIGKGPGSTVEQFTLSALRAVTNGFCESHRIGSGSFGSVYRGTLADGRDVAIKRAEEYTSASSSAAWPVRRRDRELAFLSELTALSRANHRNIVRLLGCCAEDSERVLVYEFMSNGTLHDQLHKRSPFAPPLASWTGRLKIALDAARGIEYMHSYAVPHIIHRDIKSSNILLDESWTAKVADFGLSSVLKTSADNSSGELCEPLCTAGTVGYMDPEYYRLQHLTEKSDVYSFGVVLLELLSGCRVVQRYAESVTPRNVVEFAVPHIVSDEIGLVLDPRLPPPTPGETDALAYVGYLAADCVGSVGCDRPTMTEVVDGLERAVSASAGPVVPRSDTAEHTLSRTNTIEAVLSRSNTNV